MYNGWGDIWYNFNPDDNTLSAMCGGMLQSGLEWSIVAVVVVDVDDDAVDMVLDELENRRRTSSLCLSNSGVCLSWWRRNRSGYWLFLTLLSATFTDWPPNDKEDEHSADDEHDAARGDGPKEHPGLDVNQKRLGWFIVIDVRGIIILIVVSISAGAVVTVMVAVVGGSVPLKAEIQSDAIR